MGYLDSAGLRHLWTKLEEVFSAKQDLLVGNSGQIVGFGVSGTVEAQNGWSNPNLLDNWYFADPVNQRGEKEYRNDTYTIDRWISDCSESRPLSVKGTGVAVIGDTALCQRFPKGQFDPSDVFTFSVLYEDGGFSSCTGTFHTGPSSVAGEIAVEMAASEAYDSIRFCRTDRSVSTIVAAKLEHGGIQTLARQDAAGGWVLNDPPPNKALELAKCQRHQYLTARMPYAWLSIGVAVATVQIDFPVPLPQSMDKMPALVHSGRFQALSGGTRLDITDLAIGKVTKTTAWVTASVAGAVVGSPYKLIAADDCRDAFLLFDANL